MTSTNANEILQAYKLFKHSLTLRTLRVTIERPSPMELYCMIQELTAHGTYFRASFRFECRKRGIRVFDKDELSAIKAAAHAGFTEPVGISECGTGQERSVEG